jgi:hypothetical protein
MTELAPDWFVKQLAESRLWCQPRARVGDPELCLRSSDLRPDLETYYSEDRAIWVHPAMIREVVHKRHIALASRHQRVELVDLTGATGRLLLCAYDYTNHNGATADETSYFLDDHDVPPWDSWVAEVQGLGKASSPAAMGGAWPPTLDSTLGREPPNQGLLVSWIPAEFIGLVERGLEVECVGMLCWADTPRRGGAAGPDFAAVIPRWLTALALQYMPD